MTAATYRISVSDIDNSNYTDGAQGWPVGTAAKLAERLQAEYPEIEVELIRNTIGAGGYVGEDEREGQEIADTASEILKSL